MNRRQSTNWALVLLALLPQAANAQEPAPERPATVSPSDRDEPLREQSIYIPYDKLRDVFEREGRGVFLPYDRFQALWKAAREARSDEVKQGSPVGALLTQIDNMATVDKDVVAVNATLSIELLAKGWHRVPLRLPDAAIRSAVIGGQPARVLFEPEAGYTLLVEHTADKPARVELKLEYAKAISKAPGQNSVGFQAPQAPVNRWRIEIPEPGVKVNVHPLLAATEAVAATDTRKPDPQQPASVAANATVVLALVGATPEVRIDWTPRAEGARGLDALVTVQTQQVISIDEGAIRTRTELKYEITRSDLGQLSIDVPKDHRVVNVFDPNVRSWDVAATEAGQRIAVQLFQPTRGVQNIVVELEKFRAELGVEEVAAPLVQAVNVGRQQGVVVVRLGDELRAEWARRSNVLQLDDDELPKSLAGTAWAFAFRYAALPYELSLRVEKVQPRIVAEELVEAYLEPERLTVRLAALYDIERAGVFQLEFDTPEGFELLHAQGYAVEGREPVVVESPRLTGEKNDRLVVGLARKAIGKVAIQIEMTKKLDDPNLLAPTGQASELSVPVPRVAAGTVERASGRLVVLAPESLRVNPIKQEGLRPISFEEAYRHCASMQQNRFQTLRPVLPLAFADQSATLTLSIERRKPQVTARQLLTVRVEAGVARYEADLFYEIRYSPVKQLRIDVPQSLAADLRNESSGLRDATIDPQPDDVVEDDVAWSLTGATELMGDVRAKLTWEKKIEKLDIGKSVELSVPQIRPMDVDRAWGQIVLVKAETIDLQPAAEVAGLRPIDPQHDLMAGAAVKGAARAFEFQDDWKLAVVATRYQLEAVKTSSIDRGVVRMVATRSNQLDVQALYRLRSVQQRLGVKLPAKARFDSTPLRINGQPAALETGANAGEVFVPLSAQAPDQALLLELRYTLDGSPDELVVPEFLDNPAVQKVFLCGFLPEEWLSLGARGPWDRVERFDFGGMAYDVRGGGRNNGEAFVRWVQEQVAVAGDPLQNLQTDGLLHVYSTLRPEPGAAGALHLTTQDRDRYHGLVVGFAALLGLALLFRPWSERVLVVAGVLVIAALLGVFAPQFAQQAFSDLLVLVCGLILIVWGAVWLFGVMRSGAAWRAAGAAVAGAAAMVSTPKAPHTRAPAPAKASPPTAESESERHPPTDRGDTEQGGARE